MLLPLAVLVVAASGERGAEADRSVGSPLWARTAF